LPYDIFFVSGLKNNVLETILLRLCFLTASELISDKDLFPGMGDVPLLLGYTLERRGGRLVRVDPCFQSGKVAGRNPLSSLFCGERSEREARMSKWLEKWV
jgi:hypothetical protein